MHHIHRTHRLPGTLAALAAAAALAVPALHGTATAAVRGSQHHHAARVPAEQTHNGGTGVAGRLVCPPHLPKCYG
jgi:hypothetical protein